jgi:2-oxoglutarate/2-oxoacid ferredoxin oxidoreductase subunit beta
MEERQPMLDYLRQEILPTTFCAGCGGGTVLNCFTHAVDQLELDVDRMVAVTGIGCSSWIPSPYFKVDTLHTTHGRAIAFATGVKVARPELDVVVIAGDGDLSGIGGNHLIHAARRNIGLKVFLVNNFIYGMTGGQVAPTTPTGTRTSTTPYGNPEPPLQITELVAAAGADFAARWTTFHVFQLIKAMKTAFSRDGFSFVEIISQCPTSYGKYTQQRDAAIQLRDFKANAVRYKKAQGMTPDELAGKYVIGTHQDRRRPEFARMLDDLAQQRMAEEA